jgi:hypothetical protein
VTPPRVAAVPEVLNEKAVEVITRVQQKLTGTDFSNTRLTVEEQVNKLYPTEVYQTKPLSSLKVLSEGGSIC